MKLRVPGPFLIAALKRCATQNRALRRAEAPLFHGRDGFAEKAGRWCGKNSSISQLAAQAGMGSFDCAKGFAGRIPSLRSR